MAPSVTEVRRRLNAEEPDYPSLAAPNSVPTQPPGCGSWSPMRMNRSPPKPATVRACCPVKARPWRKQPAAKAHPYEWPTAGAAVNIIEDDLAEPHEGSDSAMPTPAVRKTALLTSPADQLRVFAQRSSTWRWPTTRTPYEVWRGAPVAVAGLIAVESISGRNGRDIRHNIRNSAMTGRPRVVRRPSDLSKAGSTRFVNDVFSTPGATRVDLLWQAWPTRRTAGRCLIDSKL